MFQGVEAREWRAFDAIGCEGNGRNTGENEDEFLYKKGKKIPR